jgi:WD40 repeat protein
MCPFYRGFLLFSCLLLTMTPVRSESPAVAVDQYGDPLPPSARARLGSIRFRHGGQVLFLAYSPDGKSLVSAAADGTVSLWDAPTKQERRAFKSRLLGSQAIVCTPDSKTLVLVSDDLDVQFWDTTTGQLRHQRSGPQTPFASLAFSPDAKLLALVGQDQSLKLWDTTSGQDTLVIQGPPGPNGGNLRFMPSVVAFSPDGKVLAAGGQDGRNTSVRCWDVIGGNQLVQFSLPRNGGIQALAFAPDSKILVARDASQVTYLLDLATGKQIRQQTGRNQFGLFADTFSPDGKILASVAGDKVYLEEPATGKTIRQIATGQMGVTALAFAPDGKTLATGGINNLIRLWDVSTGKAHPNLGGHQGTVTAVAASPDGRWVATTSLDQTTRMWEFATGKERHQFRRSGSVNAGEEMPAGLAVFTPDSKVLAVAWNDGRIRLWDVADGKDHGHFENSAHRGAPASTLTFSPDARILALGGQDGSVHLREVATGRLVRDLQGFKTPDPNGPLGGMPGVTLLAYARDGKTLAVGGYDFSALGMLNGTGNVPTVRLLELATGKERRRLRFKSNPFGDPDSPHIVGMNVMFNAAMILNGDLPTNSEGLANAAFSPTGKSLAVGAGNSIILWDLASGRTVRSLGSTSSLSGSIAFSPDGKLLAAGSADGLIYLWDTATGTALIERQGHRGPVQSVTFTRDGKTLISGGTDTTALVWDVAALLEAGRHRRPTPSRQRLEALWQDLTVADSARADRAQWALVEASQQTLAFLKPRLHPAAPVDTRRLARLILDLEHDQFPVRQRASAALESMGEQAEAALRKALKETSSPEVHKRVEALLAKIESPVQAPETLRTIRVVEVLEHMGSPEACTLLQRLASGAPEARLTRDARGALERSQALAEAP